MAAEAAVTAATAAASTNSTATTGLRQAFTGRCRGRDTREPTATTEVAAAGAATAVCVLPRY